MPRPSHGEGGPANSAVGSFKFLTGKCVFNFTEDLFAEVAGFGSSLAVARRDVQQDMLNAVPTGRRQGLLPLKHDVHHPVLDLLGESIMS